MRAVIGRPGVAMRSSMSVLRAGNEDQKSISGKWWFNISSDRLSVMCVGVWHSRFSRTSGRQRLKVRALSSIQVCWCETTDSVAT
jgi:hypothetical protein